MKHARTAALLITPLVLAGCSGGSETAQPAPAPTVTVTGEPEIRTVTETPESCLDALDAAERLTASIAPALEEGSALSVLIPQAYSAGITEGTTGDSTETDAVVTEAARISAAMDAAMPEFEAALTAYKDQAQRCRDEPQ